MNLLNFLIIDDDVVDRVHYRRIISQTQQFSAKITEVDSAEQALTLCPQEKFDCIILDYHLPGMNGIEFVRELKKIGNNNVSLIMLTGQGNENIAVNAMKEGITDYVIKNDLDPDYFVDTIIKSMQKKLQENKLQEQEEQLKHFAYFDNLTGFMNRYAFEEAALRTLSEAKRFHNVIGFLYIDLDHFKNVNDIFGHAVGDALLEEVANRLRKILREEDLKARIGGDEFIILLTRLKTIDDAAIVANKIVEQIALPFQIASHVIFVGASVGIAGYPESGGSLVELLKNADVALYRAKDLGRGVFTFFSEDLRLVHEKRLNFEQALHRAIANEEFFLVYQPQFELATRKIIGMEALLRWHHPELGLVSPDQFIPIAEESGLIIPIGRWVLETACKQFKKWSQEISMMLQLNIAINLSPKELSNPLFLVSIQKLLIEIDLPPERVSLEITESALVQNIQNEGILTKLRAIRLQLSIDDFGKGSSSLSRLKKLPINSLKIDASFVEGLEAEKADVAIVKYIINIGKELDLTVVAEGIETETQLKFLIEHGCVAGQGFYFSYPLTEKEMTEFLINYVPSI